MKISKIQIVIRTAGADRMFLTTDLPSPFPPGISNPTLILSCEARAGSGAHFAHDNFPGVPVELIDANTGEKINLETTPCTT